MIIEELTHDDIMQVIEHLHDYCACRDDCDACFYADDYVNCTIKSIPAEWRPSAIEYRLKGGDIE